MRLSVIVDVLCLLLFVLASTSWGTHIRIKGLECLQMDPSFAYFEYCVLKPLNRDVKEISMLIKLLKKPVTNITIRGDIKRRFKSPFYTFNINGCIFLSSDKRNPVANAIYKFLRMDIYTNMNHSCPFDHDLVVDRLRVNANFNLPLPFGMGDYVITTHWNAYNVLRATVNIIFSIL